MEGICGKTTIEFQTSEEMGDEPGMYYYIGGQNHMTHAMELTHTTCKWDSQVCKQSNYSAGDSRETKEQPEVVKCDHRVDNTFGR